MNPNFRLPKFFYNAVAFYFTNGQSYNIKTLFRRFLNWVKIKIDFFSNKLWQTLDEPKMYASLRRFERRFNATAVVPL